MNSSYLPHTRFSVTIDQILDKLGRHLSWIWLILMLIIVLNVILRYGFNLGSIELEEMQWHLYSSGFLIGLSYAYLDDKHIRVAILHERVSPELKAWGELYGTLVFLIPFLVLIIYFSIPFITSSYELSEFSPSPGGLPFRWLIKSMLLIGFCVLFLAVASRLTRIWHFLFVGDQHAS